MKSTKCYTAELTILTQSGENVVAERQIGSALCEIFYCKNVFAYYLSLTSMNTTATYLSQIALICKQNH